MPPGSGQQEALAAIDRALDIDPRDPDLWDKRATCLEALHLMEDAKGAREKAAGLQRERSEAAATRKGATESAPSPALLGLER